MSPISLGLRPRSEKKVTMIETESLDGYRLVEPGDLVINMMWAWHGCARCVQICRDRQSPAYSVLSASNRRRRSTPAISTTYTGPAAYVAEITRHSRGIHSSRFRIDPDVFLNLLVPQPPLGEQHAIADYLDRETARIDTLIEEQQRLIEMLQERRACTNGTSQCLVPTRRAALARTQWVVDSASSWLAGGPAATNDHIGG